MEKIKRQIEGLNNTSAEVKYDEQHAFIDYWTVLVTLMFISSFFSLFLLIFLVYMLNVSYRTVSYSM